MRQGPPLTMNVTKRDLWFVLGTAAVCLFILGAVVAWGWPRKMGELPATHIGPGKALCISRWSAWGRSYAQIELLPGLPAPAGGVDDACQVELFWRDHRAFQRAVVVQNGTLRITRIPINVTGTWTVAIAQRHPSVFHVHGAEFREDGTTTAPTSWTFAPEDRRISGDVTEWGPRFLDYVQAVCDGHNPGGPVGW